MASDGEVPVYALPEVDLLMAPTVGQVAAACNGEMIAGDRMNSRYFQVGPRTPRC